MKISWTLTVLFPILEQSSNSANFRNKAGGFLTEWNTTVMQIGFIRNSNSAEKLNL